MTELQPYRQAPADPMPNQMDNWIGVMGDVAKLAEYIAETEFVPEAMRSRPAAVSAAILTGREMGLEPMTALRHIHVIKGKPGVSAEMMRAQVQAAGHSIEFVENSDSRCVLAGKRRHDTDWTRVTFTQDQAKKAKIDLGSYPEDKLIARATSRLCRRKFADVVAGLTAVDELEDEQGAAKAEQPEQPQRKTAQRRQSKQPPKQVQQQPPKQVEQVPAADAPPLPGEEEPAEQAEPVEEQHGEPVTEWATRSQLTKLGTIFSNAGVTDREQRVRVSGQIINRQLSSAKDMTKSEAGTLINTLEELAETGDLAQTISGLVEAHQPDTDGSLWPEPAQPGSKAQPDG